MKRKIAQNLVIFLFFTLIIFATLFTFFNTFKFFYEIKEWAFLSDYDKRKKIFGNQYDYLIFINENIPPGTKILVYSENEMTHLLGRYYLYPNKIIVINNLELFKINSKTYRYVSIFNKNVEIDDFKKIDEFTSTDKKDAGYLFIKK